MLVILKPEDQGFLMKKVYPETGEETSHLISVKPPDTYLHLHRGDEGIRVVPYLTPTGCLFALDTVPGKTFPDWNYVYTSKEGEMHLVFDVEEDVLVNTVWPSRSLILTEGYSVEQSIEALRLAILAMGEAHGSAEELRSLLGMFMAERDKENG
jgi:hypothetical protein